ncbi:STAS domain-containing protein [Streptomyces silvensis]|uniref:STAS domain-containing protein n=1 Tax=Streptomyces silvensis TaxID=1765722 RepID=A0A0W7WX12_9ACTN|nr:STAS domain-containing protein [Streptomyces silvensis]KUF15125.1 hypothetical protein AT728_27110 [Streptomyces silvensis]
MVWSQLTPDTHFSVTRRPAPDATTLRVAGELDAASLPALAKTLLRPEHSTARVRLDLSRVTFCAPAALEMLGSASRHLGTHGGELIVERAHSQFQRLLQLCGPPPGLQIRPPPTVGLAPDEYRRREALVSETLTLARRITGAPMGNAQLLDPATRTLRIVTHYGFQHPFLSFFETVHDRDSACGVAADDRDPVYVEEVAVSAIFRGTPALDVLNDAHVGAVCSLPITSRDGALIGVISTHHSQPTAWSRELQDTLNHLARAAGHIL